MKGCLCLRELNRCLCGMSVVEESFFVGCGPMLPWHLSRIALAPDIVHLLA